MNAIAIRRLAALLALLLLLLAAAESLAQSVDNGRELYQTFCAPCHGNPPLGGAATAGNNPMLIRDAINGREPSMNVLSFLTDQNLADIAAWIGSVSGTSPPPPPPAPPVPDRDYTDLWWGGDAESGWGFNIIQHSTHNIFGVMYTYDANGHPIWFVLPGGSWTSSTTFSGAWYRVTGKPYDRAFAPPEVQQVGIVTMTFTDASHGKLGFVVNGTIVNKSIERQPF